MGRTALGTNDRKILQGAVHVVGVDEVGRGCLAGPVVVCGVSFVRIPRNPLIQDSKTLTARQRGIAADWVLERCADWLLVEIWPELIDRLNILGAVRLAMRTAVATLARPGTVAVVDHVDLGDVGVPLRTQPKADSSFFCVAAASIVAKVHRDRLMAELAVDHHHWEWERNKGYGTAAHRSALQEHGRSYLHRRSFAWSPVVT